MRSKLWVAVLALALAPGIARAQEIRAAVPNPMAEGALEGQRAAEMVGTSGYFAGGFISGITLGLIGTGIAWAVASSSDVSIPASTQAAIQANGPEWVYAYQTAFAERLKARRKSAALSGGLLGTAAFLVIFVAAN